MWMFFRKGITTNTSRKTVNTFGLAKEEAVSVIIKEKNGSFLIAVAFGRLCVLQFQGIMFTSNIKLTSNSYFPTTW